MQTILLKTWEWYKKLPWYFKLIGWVVFILIGVISPFIFFRPDKPDHADAVDNTVLGNTEERVNDIERENAQIKKDIITKKKEIATKLNQARNIDAKTLEGRKKIEAATTMEELDKLQKELGL